MSAGGAPGVRPTVPIALAGAMPARRSGPAPGVSAPLPLTLYLHLPWCLRKCPYCDFNSHEWRGAGDPPQRAYVDALIADLEAALPQVWGRTVQAIFLGGGTPSLFEPAEIDRLLAAVRARLRLAADCEITMEANPGTFERARFEAYAGAGVNRLSIGVQSFDDASLQALGRVHDGAQARAAIETAARVVPTFNLDLMYALPRQSMAALEADLRTALAFSPPHLSYYHLTLEPNTLFAARPPALPDDDEAAAMQMRIEQAALEAGLEPYEVSAFARDGHRSRHNLNYWTFGDYLGIGAGAHGKLSFHDRIVRQSRLRHPLRYIEAVAAGTQVETERTVGLEDLGFEFMLNALRLREGVPTTLFAERTGASLAAIAREIDAAVSRGLLDADPTVLRPTALGRDFLNELQAMFLRD